MLERSVFCPILEVTPTHDKKTRAQAINGRMAQRMVYFPSFAPWWGEARDQLLKFPFGSHDDFVDMLAWLGLGLGSFRHIPVRKKTLETRGRKSGRSGWIKAEGQKELTPRTARGVVNVAEKEKLWLWRNGPHEFWAFEQPLPYLHAGRRPDGGTGLASLLIGYAIFNESYIGLPDRSDDYAMQEMLKAKVG